MVKISKGMKYRKGKIPKGQNIDMGQNTERPNYRMVKISKGTKYRKGKIPKGLNVDMGQNTKRKNCRHETKYRKHKMLTWDKITKEQNVDMGQNAGVGNAEMTKHQHGQ